MTSKPTARAQRRRWITASELLRLVHSEPGITRTAAAARLALSSGTTTELIDRLRAVGLLAEQRAEQRGRGRPTTVLRAHPEGPLVAVVDLQSSRWQVWLGDLAGGITEVADGRYGDAAPTEFLPRIAEVIAAVAAQASGRLRAVVAAAAGTVSGTTLLQFATRDWQRADLRVLTGALPAGADVVLLAGNDATLGGVAEARNGAARSAHVALHILVAVGVGGALLVDGHPMTGAHGSGGEYGHLPFGDPALACPCGAHGCWDLTLDGRALARHLGDAPPEDPIAYGQRLLASLRRGRGTRRQRAAAESIAEALGAGIAGLVNLHDPDVVTLAGLGPAVRATMPDAFARAYRRGLMSFQREHPTPILDAAHEADGPVRGALALGFDHLTSPDALAGWFDRDGRQAT